MHLPRFGRLAPVLVLCAALGVGAADPQRDWRPPPPPRFAPPARGVLFADDFTHGLRDWSPDTPGVWSVADGVLQAQLPDRKQQRSLLYAGDFAWHDYALDVDVCMTRGVDKGVVVRVQGDTGLGVDLRGGTYQDVVAYVREWPAGKAAALNADATWNHLRVEVRGARMRVYVNGELKLDRRQARTLQGRIALAAYTGGAAMCTAYYANVVVTAL